MSKNQVHLSLIHFHNWILRHIQRGKIPAGALTVILAGVIGVLGGYGAVFFTFLIDTVSSWSVEPVLKFSGDNKAWLGVLCVVPALGLLLVSWFTRRFAPEAQGHGVPEVITAIARHDGVIRPRVSLVKILASGFCIGTGGSIGREGPIVQIGSSLGSMSGQLFKLSARRIKVLVAAGAAAGISATFNAPLAGVIFASEIILGSFAIESLTPIVIASVLADVVQQQVGEHGTHSAFVQLNYEFQGAWEQLPAYLVLGLACGLAAVGFINRHFPDGLSLELIQTRNARHSNNSPPPSTTAR
jgi:CIC family chloride channel protein